MALLDFLMRKSKESISLDEAAQILKTDPELLRKFDEKYQECILSETDSDNLFTINAKQVAEENFSNISVEIRWSKCKRIIKYCAPSGNSSYSNKK